MKNLENYGVQELSAREINETDGGFIAWLAGALVGSFLYAVIEDWDGNVAAFEKGYNQTK